MQPLGRSPVSETPVEDFDVHVLNKPKVKATGVKKLFKGK